MVQQTFFFSKRKATLNFDGFTKPAFQKCNASKTQILEQQGLFFWGEKKIEVLFLLFYCSFYGYGLDIISYQ